MNKKLEIYKTAIRNKRVAVVGLGINSTSLVEYLCKLGVDVTVFDKSDEASLGERMALLKEYPVHYHLGSDYLKSLEGFDVIFRSPGVRYDMPELVEAREKGAVVTSEMEVFFALCPAEIFAVTGSEGKTTTTTIIHKILEGAGYGCLLGGSIGTPILNRIDEILPEHKVVLELNGFQLQSMTQSPRVAVITNLSPTRLDAHKSMEEYINVEKNIFRFQNPDDILVLNYDNDVTRAFMSEAPSRAVFFSRRHDPDEGAVLKDGMLCFKYAGGLETVIDRKDIQLPGDHNVENFLAAMAATREYVKPEAVKMAAQAVKSIEHRMEFVRELNGVSWYNDSVGSSPTRTMAALGAFDRKIILIAGGYDKNISYAQLGPVLAEKVKHLILIGQTASMIEMALMTNLRGKNAFTDIRITHCSTLEQAVYSAYFSARKGDIVLLSPASASFDMFRNFEDRGEKFKDLVRRL